MTTTRRLRRPGLLVCLLLALSGPALARDCADPQTTAEMRLCTAEEIAAERRAIAVLVTEITARVSPLGAERLEAAQTSWRTWRDREADFVGIVAGAGTLGPLLSSLRVLEITRQRKDYLQSVLDDLD